MKLKIGDRIFYQKNGEFYADIISESITGDGETLYVPVEYDWWCITEDELLDESDERVRDYMCLRKDGMVKLSDVRRWLESHARTYYESDSWSSFKSDEMIKDLCKTMLYSNK